MSGVIYAGIGARKTPKDVLRKMRNAAKAMATMGFTLRSGGAPGADCAFSEGYEQVLSPDGFLEIYLPKYQFNGFICDGITCHGPPGAEARAIAKTIHPYWANLGNLGRDFMARNAHQILGLDLETPCQFILCWTADGKASGGTGQAIRHADKLGIPVLNFRNQSDDEISDFIFSINESHSA